jgi:hypothetical protein
LISTSSRNRICICDSTRTHGVPKSIQETNTRYDAQYNKDDVREPRDAYHKTPQAHWSSVWKNLCEAPVPGSRRALWYKVIRDILPMSDRLYGIRVISTDSCRICDKIGTLEYRLTDCGEGKNIWNWTKHRLALILKTAPGRIPDG